MRGDRACRVHCQRLPSFLPMALHEFESPRYRSAGDGLVYLFDAVEAMESLVLECISQPLHRDALDVRTFAWTATVKALKSADSVRLLCDAGYGSQGMAVARTVFEDAVIARWCAIQDGAELLGHLRKHEQSVSMRLQRDVPGRDEYQSIAAMAVLSDAQLDAAAEEWNVKSGIATRLWTGRNVREMVEDIASTLTASEASTVRTLHDVGYLLANLATHNSPASLSSAVRPEGLADGVQILSRRPSRLFVHDSLVITFHSLSLLARLVVPESRHPELDQLIEHHRWTFVALRPDVGKVRRNEPCPCGSNRKFKNCHGERV